MYHAYRGKYIYICFPLQVSNSLTNTTCHDNRTMDERYLYDSDVVLLIWLSIHTCTQLKYLEIQLCFKIWELAEESPPFRRWEWKVQRWKKNRHHREDHQYRLLCQHGNKSTILRKQKRQMQHFDRASLQLQHHHQAFGTCMHLMKNSWPLSLWKSMSRCSSSTQTPYLPSLNDWLISFPSWWNNVGVIVTTM